MNDPGDVATEAVVRAALRKHLLAETANARDALEELWVPRSHERADLALIGHRMDGFEIKTERDTLRRLPRQVGAYGRLFDRCVVVVAEKHHEKVYESVPDWWGVTMISVNGQVSFVAVRKPRQNPTLDPETLVRLLWRDEAMAALRALGVNPHPKAHRATLWDDLLNSATLTQLRRVVRRALLGRDASRARIPTRRFRTKALVAAAHP
jgi:hypothetical protein